MYAKVEANLMYAKVEAYFCFGPLFAILPSMPFDVVMDNKSTIALLCRI